MAEYNRAMPKVLALARYITRGSSDSRAAHSAQRRHIPIPWTWAWMASADPGRPAQRAVWWPASLSTVLAHALTRTTSLFNIPSPLEKYFLQVWSALCISFAYFHYLLLLWIIMQRTTSMLLETWAVPSTFRKFMWQTSRKHRFSVVIFHWQLPTALAWMDIMLPEPVISRTDMRLFPHLHPLTVLEPHILSRLWLLTRASAQ